MARAVPDAITEALSSPVQQPSISCRMLDAFDRPYATISHDFSGPSTMIQLPSGGYVRAYVSQPGMGVDASVHTQTFADPNVDVGLDTYALRSASAAQQAGVELVLFGATIFLFYQRLADLHLCFQTSVDGGVTWSAEQVAAATSVRVWAIASAGNDDLFLAQNGAGGDSAQDVVQLAYAAGSFAVTATWTNSSNRIMGLSVVYESGTYRFVAGAASRAGGGMALCAMTRAAGGWSPLTAIHPIDDPLTGPVHS